MLQQAVELLTGFRVAITARANQPVGCLLTPLYDVLAFGK